MDDFDAKVASYLSEAGDLSKKARAAFREIRKTDTAQRNSALIKMALLLEEKENQDEILAANAKDIARSDDFQLSDAMKDRLRLNSARILSMVQALREIAAFPDPVGEILGGGKITGNIEMIKKRVPLGVVFTVYESRPNVTVDIGALCLKSGNAAILRGGKEAVHTNRALHSLFQTALRQVSLPQDSLSLVEETDRAFMVALLKQDALIDLVVPRGGEGLIRFVSEHSRIPLVKHDKGVCNLFIDKSADPVIALRVAVNSKLQRPSVCNSIENLILHKDFTGNKDLLAGLSEAGVILRGCKKTCAILPSVEPISGEEEYHTEYLDNRLSVIVVDGLEDAVDFIHKYGSGHSEGIIAEENGVINQFSSFVDSAAIFINCSTRFHDGGQMGMGAEVGISTGRLHVRGPMGLRDLTTTTYIMKGSGQIRG